jgi:ABC-type multidrug transport system ATPase subunit
MNPEAMNFQSGFPLLGRGVGVRLDNVGKRYNREWIFRRCSYDFMPGKRYAITGSNGSGKSTLLQVIAGAIQHNEGIIEYRNGQQAIDNGQHYTCVSLTAPYLELIEEMTASEMLEFHSKFKPLVQSLSIAEILKLVGLENAADKQIRYFSSGMKQRLKLAQAFFSNTPILLLDEPATNLDADGIALYHALIRNYTKDRLVIVSSNDKQEYDFCEEVIEIGKYK